ncbi:MAG: hypothetical protein K9N23_10035 [Akkermansiaceae bacterium]|nr:hypothetical protein [Akkermansiaceae bacterium]
MKHSSYSFCRLAAGLLAGIVTLVAPARAQDAVQTITLTAGWNAVWLEVEPVDATGQAKPPTAVFNNPAILIAATPKPLAGLAEFFAGDPGTITTFNKDEWQQWKRTDPADSNNLPLIRGNRPYLIQVAAGTATFSLPLSGKARFFRPTWTPDRYNLIGFGLQGAPTFDAFFGPSGTKHPISRIFTLNATTGNWQHVTASAQMVSGRAYWVYCSGPSNYMGPVSVDFDLAVSGTLGFGGPSDAVAVGSGVDALTLDLKELVFSNIGATPISPELDLIAASPGSGNLALYVVSPAADRLAYERGNRVDSAAGEGASSALGETVNSQTTATLTLGAQRNWSDDNPRTNIYRLKTGAAGASFWLPVTAIRSELQPSTGTTADPPASEVTGLWVGEVAVNGATSIVEDGAPVRPSAGSAPMRILLHSDSSGTVRLLSQVTIMQTKSADPAVAPVPVLVVDPKRIPFFEGVKERNGKRAGLRIEAIAYDMPRDSSIGTQADEPVNPDADDLIAMIVSESTSPVTKWASGKGFYTTREAVTPEAIDSYLLFRDLRPPALKEIYLTSLPMTGSVGKGQSVSGTLTLDPFHRTNPFRHAYHQRHPKGPNITRAITLSFDSGQALPDRLSGTFSETVQGLINSNLTLTGRIELRRVSPVATLEGAQ